MEVTNPDRILFPDPGSTTGGITKGEVVAHYARVADRILPHLRDRPLTIHRFPRGIGAKGFMQKNAPDHYPPNIDRIELPKRGGTTTYPEVHDEDGLLYLANLSAITFHVPTSRRPTLHLPDRFIIDLDPPDHADRDGGGDGDDGAGAAAKRAATIVGQWLAERGVPTIPMTTGSKGYHVVANLEPDPDLGYERVGRFAQALALLLGEAHPDALTTEFRIANRGGRVFVDWLRNNPMATGVAPWSLRARPGAPMAVPITWDELTTTPPDRWTITDTAPPDNTAPPDRTAHRSTGGPLDRPDPLATLAPVSLVPTVEAVEAELAARGVELPRFDRFRS